MVRRGRTLHTYTYNGDGERVKAVVTIGADIKTTAYVGNYFEISIGAARQVTPPTPPACGGTVYCGFLPLVVSSMPPIPAGHAWTSYYYAGSYRLAQRVHSNQQGVSEGLYYFLTDHLGSTTVTLDENGNQLAELRYKAWGEIRYSTGTTPTQRKFTGQLESEAGLYFYQARYYDPSLGRFLSPDTLISDPGSPMTWDRFAFSRNNPVNYNDPSGHTPTLVTALFGALIGAGVNYTIQVINNVNSKSMSLGDAMDFSNIDKKSLIVATAGGAVAGLTLGLSTLACTAAGMSLSGATIVSDIAGGALANVLSGQAQALTGAALDQVEQHTNRQENILNFQPNGDEFWNDAKSKGLGDTNTIIYDGGVGAILGTLGTLGKGAFFNVGSEDLLTLGGKTSIWIRPATEFLDYGIEYWKQIDVKDRAYDDQP